MNPDSIHVYELRQEVIHNLQVLWRAHAKKVQRPERGVLAFVGAVRGRSLWVLLLRLGCEPQDGRDHASGQVRGHSWPGSGD